MTEWMVNSSDQFTCGGPTYRVLQDLQSEGQLQIANMKVKLLLCEKKTYRREDIQSALINSYNETK